MELYIITYYFICNLQIIQIMVPHELNRTHWWASDISLLKTLEQFLKTPAVQATQLLMERNFSDKSCNIVVFKVYEFHRPLKFASRYSFCLTVSY